MPCGWQEAVQVMMSVLCWGSGACSVQATAAPVQFQLAPHNQGIDHLLLKVYKILCQGRARSGQQRKCSWEQVSLAFEEDYIQGSALAHSPSSQLCGRKEDMDQTHHPLTLWATLLLGCNEHLATCIIFDYVQNQSLQPGVPVYLSQV